MNDTDPPAGNRSYVLSSVQTFAGLQTFCRCPPSKDLAGVDVAVLGVPFDVATSFRPGARFGPNGVRAGSVQLRDLKSFPYGIDPFATVKVIDYGDVWFDYGHSVEAPGRIEATARNVVDSGAFLCSIGGDHFVTYPLLKAHVAKHGPVALVHFDAHPDTWRDSDKDGQMELSHGTMFCRAVREGLIVPERSVQVGIRTWVDDTMGISILDAPWVHEHGPKAALAEIKRIVGGHKAYLTFDIDCLDPVYAPGTGTPVAGGLSTAQAFAILRGLGDLDLVGLDVVEVAPAYDNAEVTAIAGATIIYDQICLMALKRGARSLQR
jgi:agmatinase